jgi:hypothetical protein
LLRALGILLLGFVIGLTGAAQEPKPEEPKKPAVEFQRDILPLFEAKCLRCHGGRQRAGGLDLRTVASLLKGGNSGPAMVPGKSEKSLLVELIHFNEMPPKKEKNRVGKEELDRIRAWIDACGCRPIDN